MTNTELILNMLAEASTKDITEVTEPERWRHTKRSHGKVARSPAMPDWNSKPEQAKRWFRVSMPNRSWLQRTPNKSKCQKMKNKSL